MVVYVVAYLFLLYHVLVIKNGTGIRTVNVAQSKIIFFFTYFEYTLTIFLGYGLALSWIMGLRIHRSMMLVM